MVETLAQPKLSKYFSAAAYWKFFSLFWNDVQPELKGICPAISLLAQAGKYSLTRICKAEPQTGREMEWICLQVYTTLASALAVPLRGLFWQKSRNFSDSAAIKKSSTLFISSLWKKELLFPGAKCKLNPTLILLKTMKLSRYCSTCQIFKSEIRLKEKFCY